MAEQKDVLVIGGGITGITAAIEAAEAGLKAVLVEKNPYLGGRVAQLNKYFPKLCPPVCGIEMNLRRVKENRDIEFLTMAQVEKISGEEGNFEVTVKTEPRYVNAKCTMCDACAKACPAERSNDFNFGMDKTKAAYISFNQAFPALYAIDKKACKQGCGEACKAACKYNAIDLDMKAETMTFNVKSIVAATGWDPYDAKKIDNLGFGKVKNVITNMMMERLASPSGPTAGKIIRPSDGKEVKSVAFVQCAGSRDENHLRFCSYICCLASLKQATYVKEQYPDAKTKIFYIDIRTPGRYEQFFWKVRDEHKIELLKGKVAEITEDKDGGVIVVAEDVLSGRKVREKFDLVVLATGMEPAAKKSKVPGLELTPDGFAIGSKLKKGFAVAGTAKNPSDVALSVRDATGAAMKSIQSAGRK